MKATFLRVIEAEDKAQALKQAVANPHSGHRFELDPRNFRAVPRAPFAYWASDRLRAIFRELPRFEGEGRTAKQGLATADDFRFVRLWMEVPETALGTTWFSFAKGGKFSPFYADVYLVVNWAQDGGEISTFVLPSGRIASRPQNTDFYLRPGLTWPLRAARFGPSALPVGSIPSVRGYGAYSQLSESLPILAVFNSAAFDAMFKLSLGRAAFPEFIVGVLNEMPWPMVGEVSRQKLAFLARCAWSLKRSLDTCIETSHAFVLPPCLNEKVTGLDPAAVERQLLEIQSQIDDEAYRLYGIGPEDRAAIEAMSKVSTSNTSDESTAEDDDAGDEDEAVVAASTDTLISWLVGVAFARFDLRLATGERPIPPEPDPFDPLPTRSPGMIPQGQEPPDAPDILVDDQGHKADLASRVRAHADPLGLDVPEDLRAWLAKEFFPLHVQMYSKSRRKAPIYWQLATPSASYSVWLYYHRLTRDTLYRVLNDFVTPKLQHEERKLTTLIQDAGPTSSVSQRKEIDTQEKFVEELRTFREEVARLAPLWNPYLNDGVIINFAPLLRLVPQHKPWQNECKACWDKLVAGDYDWAHLAMHLWPERVVPKCMTDRSLAIAHGLEEVFWEQGTDGKWKVRAQGSGFRGQETIDSIIDERTSASVKAALKSLMDAPAPSAGRGGGKRRPGRKTRSTENGGRS